jgi:hypothetical protein
MTALLVNTQHQHDLAAGKSGIWIWKNLAVWSVNAIPVPTGDTQKGCRRDACDRERHGGLRCRF